MSKIDTTQWKEFVISDLFYIKRPIARSQANYSEGVVPFVASGNFNNGVLKYLTPKEKEQLDKGNCITVSPIDGSCFYQERDFLGRGGAGSSIILLYNDKLNLYSGYFIATIIRVVCQKYIYNDMANKNIIASEKIKLPVDINGNPNFAYMEEYMQNLETTIAASLTALRLAKSLETSKSLNVVGWGKFEIGKLFEIRKGKRLTKANMVDGEIPFIGASSFNNGITAYIGNTEHLHSKNTITMSYNGSVGEAFYQEEPFWASDDVNVLYPKIKFNRDIAMFIIPLLKKAGQKYAFIDKWKKEDMEKDCIYLPVNTKKEIDFNYIEHYIQNKCLKIDKSLSSIFAV